MLEDRPSIRGNLLLFNQETFHSLVRNHLYRLELLTNSSLGLGRGNSRLRHLINLYIQYNNISNISVDGSHPVPSRVPTKGRNKLIDHIFGQCDFLAYCEPC